MFGQKIEGTRSAVDLFHFGVAFTGFVFAVGGVVISAQCVCCVGLLLLAWGVAYFAVDQSEE
jgi:hypothetical protein